MALSYPGDCLRTRRNPAAAFMSFPQQSNCRPGKWRGDARLEAIQASSRLHVDSGARGDPCVFDHPTNPPPLSWVWLWDERAFKLHHAH